MIETVPYDEFTSEAEIIDAPLTTEDVEKRGLWGDQFVKITRQQWEALGQGHVLFFNDGEYCHYLMIEKSTRVENETVNE